MERNKSIIILSVFTGMMFLSSQFIFAADDLATAFKEGSTSGLFRIYHWKKSYNESRSSYDDSKSTLAGGILSYETAPLKGITAGVGFRAQHQLLTHDEYRQYACFYPQDPSPSGSGMVDDDSGIEAMSEAFLRYSGGGTVLTYGRHYIDTPYINESDYRMLPNVFQGISLVNKSLETVEFNAGYFTAWMDWSDSEYKDMIVYLEEVRTHSGQVEKGKGAYFGGMSWQPIRGIDANIWYYRFNDVSTIITPQFKWVKAFNENWKSFFDLRYTKWNDAGEKLAGELDTDMIGFIAGLTYQNISLVLYGQKNGDQNPLEPFGHRRACTMQVTWAELAEEEAFLVKLGYNFAAFDLKGLDFYIRYGMFDTPDLGEKNAAQDKDELEFSLTYDFDKKWEGLSVRLRYALIDMKDEDKWLNLPSVGPDVPANIYNPEKRRSDAQDFRFYLEYEF